MSSKTEVEKKDVGYRFHISIDKELHVESGTKTPDKITIHASMEGNTDTYNQAMNQLKEAKKQVMDEITQQEESSTGAKPSPEASTHE